MKNGHHFKYEPIRTKNLKAVNRRLERINAREEAFAWRFLFTLIIVLGSITFAEEIDQFFESLTNQIIFFVVIVLLGSLGYLVYWFKRQ